MGSEKEGCKQKGDWAHRVCSFRSSTGRNRLGSLGRAGEIMHSSAAVVACWCQSARDLVLPVPLNTCSTRFFSHPVPVTCYPIREAPQALRDGSRLLSHTRRVVVHSQLCAHPAFSLVRNVAPKSPGLSLV